MKYKQGLLLCISIGASLLYAGNRRGLDKSRDTKVSGLALCFGMPLSAAAKAHKQLESVLVLEITGHRAPLYVFHLSLAVQRRMLEKNMRELELRNAGAKSRAIVSRVSSE